MELFHFDPAQALPLEGGTRATYVPVRNDDRLVATLIHLDRRGDTGMRELATDLLLVVISGEGQARSGGQVAAVKAGDVCILPGGMRHTIWTTDVPMDMMLVLLGGE